MSTMDTYLEVDEKGGARVVDRAGKDWNKSYADKFTEKLRQNGIHDLTYNAKSPFLGRNEKEKQIVQRIVQELSAQ